VIDRDGRLLVGVPAFAALWRELPRHRWLARLATAPLLLPLWTALYDALAAVLYAWNRRRLKRHPELAAPKS
jgi:predicted DCC family thiol-disulfide oxidoreductase YuxK